MNHQLSRNARGRNGSFRPIGNRQGAAALEMALVAPFILMISFSSIEFSRVMMVKQALTNAAREGCRTASLATTTSTEDVEDRIRQLLKNSVAFDESNSVISVTTQPSNLQGLEAGEPVQTIVSVGFSEISWLPPRWMGTASLVGKSTMRRE